jgi:hypothetical protein
VTHPSDKELDDYLRRESQVSESYRMLDANDVPPALDAAVMAQARAAVAQPAKSQRRIPAWVRWGSPLALAASAVMIVAIVLEVGVQDELRVPAPQMKQSQTDAESTVAQAPLAEAVESDEAKVAREVVERPLQALAQDAPAFVSEPAEPVNVPQAAPPPAPAPAPAPKLERARQASSRVSANVQQPAPQQSAFSDNSARREAEEVIVTGSNIRPTPEDAAMSVGAIEAPPELKSNDRTRPAFGPRAPGAPRVVNAEARAAAAEPAPDAMPEIWLEAIRKLRAAGRHAEADEEWRAFRRVHPNFEVRAGDAALPEPLR